MEGSVVVEEGEEVQIFPEREVIDDIILDEDVHEIWVVRIFYDLNKINIKDSLKDILAVQKEMSKFNFEYFKRKRKNCVLCQR